MAKTEFPQNLKLSGNMGKTIAGEIINNDFPLFSID